MPPRSTHNPELMLRRFEALGTGKPQRGCGCGGGQAVRTVLPAVLQRAQALVLDADALNVISTDGALQQALTARSARQRPRCSPPSAGGSAAAAHHSRTGASPPAHGGPRTGKNSSAVALKGILARSLPTRRHSAHQSYRQWEPGHGGQGMYSQGSSAQGWPQA